MKKTTLFWITGILLMFAVSACMKHDWGGDNGNGSGGGSGNGSVESMNDLEVTDEFDWATTKKVSIQVTLPEDEANEPLRIYNQDESELLYIGYGNDIDVVNSEITVASDIDIFKVYYGFDRYFPFEIGVEESFIYDYNEGLVESFKRTKADCGCDGGLTSLTMKYTGSNPATIHIREKKGNREIFFKANVQADEEFTFTGSGSNGKMDKTIRFYEDGRYKKSLHVSCSKELLIGDEIGNFTIVSGLSEGDKELCSPDIQCGCEGGLVQMKLRYTGSTANLIKVYEKKSFKQIYCGVVQPNGEFSFTGTKKDGRLDNTIYVYVGSSQNTSIHTSCSVSIEIGDTYGDFKIAAASNKNNMSLCGSIDPVDDDDDTPDNSGGGSNTTSSIDGTLAYEDLWPSKGDYDFNDLVISYDIDVTKNSNEEVLNIAATFVVHAFGASFHNGFGFVLPNVNPNQIISASGYQITNTDVYSIASNGLEQGQSKATIIVYDDSYNILDHPGQGLGVNTVQGAPYVTPNTVKVDITFFDNGSFATGGAIKYSALDIGSFNPFIVINQDRSREVHLPNYPPTDLADQDIFGTVNDNSIPASNRYYKTEDNKPWAIHIPILFDHPKEKIDIVKGYLKFADWVQSSGQQSKDWYEDISGYRDSDQLYLKPN